MKGKIIEVLKEAGYSARRGPDGPELYFRTPGGDRAFPFPEDMNAACDAAEQYADVLDAEEEGDSIFMSMWGVAPDSIDELPEKARAKAREDVIKARAAGLDVVTAVRLVRDVLCRASIPAADR